MHTARIAQLHQLAVLCMTRLGLLHLFVSSRSWTWLQVVYIFSFICSALTISSDHDFTFQYLWLIFFFWIACCLYFRPGLVRPAHNDIKLPTKNSWINFYLSLQDFHSLPVPQLLHPEHLLHVLKQVPKIKSRNIHNHDSVCSPKTAFKTLIASLASVQVTQCITTF